MHDRREESGELRQEANLYTQYIIDNKPSEEIIERYIDANRKLGIDVVSGPDERIISYSLKHPWSIPFLDAAAGFLQPQSLLRKKVYTMAAVLETSTHYNEFFLPATMSVKAFIVGLFFNILTVCLKVVIGAPLFWIARGFRD
jgi:hypothetical protein